VAGDAQRRRYRCNPVEAIKHPEKAEAPESEVRVRQVKQGKTAQSVIPGEQTPIVITIGEPAGQRRSDEVEDAHHREYAGGANFGDAAVYAKRNEVSADQAVRAQSANKETAAQ